MLWGKSKRTESVAGAREGQYCGQRGLSRTFGKVKGNPKLFLGAGLQPSQSGKAGGAKIQHTAGSPEHHAPGIGGRCRRSVHGYGTARFSFPEERILSQPESKCDHNLMSDHELRPHPAGSPEFSAIVDSEAQARCAEWFEGLCPSVLNLSDTRESRDVGPKAISGWELSLAALLPYSGSPCVMKRNWW